MYDELCRQIRELETGGWSRLDLSAFTRGLEALGLYVFETNYARAAVSHGAAYNLLTLRDTIQTSSLTASLLLTVIQEIGNRFERQSNRCYEVLDPVDQGDVIGLIVQELPIDTGGKLTRAMRCIEGATGENRQGPVFEQSRSAPLMKAKQWLSEVIAECGSQIVENVELGYALYMELAFCCLRLGWETSDGELIKTAEQEYKGILDRHSGRSIALYRYGTCLELNGKDEEGMEFLEMAFEHLGGDSSIPAGHWIRMRIARRLGERIWRLAVKECQNGEYALGEVFLSRRERALKIVWEGYMADVDTGARFANEERIWSACAFIGIVMEGRDMLTDIDSGNGEVAEKLLKCFESLSCGEIMDHDDIRIVFYYMRLAGLFDVVTAKQCAERVLYLYNKQGYTERDAEHVYYERAMREHGVAGQDESV